MPKANIAHSSFNREKKDPISWSNAINIVRIVAMLMVINLHTLLNFTQRSDFFLTKLWWLLEPIAILSAAATWIFFLLSGYLMLSKKETIAQNWKRTLDRLIIPLVFFELVNFLSLAIIKHPWQEFNLGEFVASQLYLLNTYPSSSLWFLVVLVVLYLLNPLWRLLFEKQENRPIAQYVTYFFLLWPLVINFFNTDGGEIYTAMTSWIAFVGLYLFGGLVRFNWQKFTSKKSAIITIIIGSLLLFLGDYGAYTWNGWLLSLIDYVGNLLSAIGIFRLLIDIDWLKLFHNSIQKQRWLAATAFFASLTFGIYLLHAIVIDILFNCFGWSFDNQIIKNVYLYITLNWLLVIVSSGILAFIVARIPYFRRVIGLSEPKNKNRRL